MKGLDAAAELARRVARAEADTDADTERRAEIRVLFGHLSPVQQQELIETARAMLR